MGDGADDRQAKERNLDKSRKGRGSRDRQGGE